jgi:signal transduction histidine kinase
MSETEQTQTLVLRPLQMMDGLQEFYPLSGEKITIGRHPTNDINIPVESVSRFHARIEKQGDRTALIDQDSSNGTYVNGKRIQTADLEIGQTVTFGNVQFRYELAESAAASSGERFAKTPVEFVSANQKQSHLIMQAEAGKRETVPLDKFIQVPADRESLVKAYRKLAVLYKLSDVLRSAPEEQQLLECFVDLVFEIVPADRAVILMREGPDEDLQIRVARSREAPDQSGSIAISRTIIDRCIAERLAILSQDAMSDERFKGAESVVLHDIRSTMVVPLVGQRGILGVLHLDTRESVHAFNDDDLNFVTSLANDLALFLDHRRISEENLRNQEMAAVGEVITDLAHNIKNILLLAEGGIKLMDRLIDEGDLPRVQQTWDLTQKTLGRISTMVKEMLDFARAPHVAKVQANLNTLVRETCESYKTEFENKGIRVKLRLDRRVGDTMLDAEGLDRALVNLLLNACEAIRHDHGEIIVTTLVNPNRDLSLIVEDNGSGIPAAKLSRVFFPMFTTKGEGGAGLGLAMVKKWVSAVGGTIRAYSTEGAGARFVITLPYEAVPVAEEL